MTDVPAVDGCAICAARAEAGYSGACAQHQRDAATAGREADRVAARTYERNRVRLAELQKSGGRMDQPLTTDEAEAIHRFWDRAGRNRISEHDTDLLDLAEKLGRKPISVKLWIEQLMAFDSGGRTGLSQHGGPLAAAWADGFRAVAS